MQQAEVVELRLFLSSLNRAKMMIAKWITVSPDSNISQSKDHDLYSVNIFFDNIHMDVAITVAITFSKTSGKA